MRAGTGIIFAGLGLMITGIGAAMTDYSDSAGKNPAANAEGKSLAELFRTDPMELTKQDRDKIIATFRQERSKFLQQEEGKKTQGKAASKKSGGGINIDLDDVEI